MKRTLAVLFTAAALAACQDASQPTAPTGPPAASVRPAAPGLALKPMGSGPERVMPGEVLVKAKPGVDVTDVARGHGLSVDHMGYRNTFAVLHGAAAGAEHAAAAALKQDARVEWAEPNYLRQVTAFDTRLWAFYNPGDLTITFTRGGSRGQVVSSKISTADADEDNIESYATGGGDVVIGSIDTGVDFTHQEFLSGQLIAGHDWYNNDNDPSDDEGHGTHTTGTMAGKTVGVAGVSGAGPHVKVYVQKVCGNIGCPTDAIVNAIRAAADYPNMVAMNMSLGGSSESQAEKDAITYATSKNVLVIASAGNDGTGTVSCPACDPNAISVAATNWQDTLSYYSNWGPGLDISAPGGEMYSNTSEEGGIYSSVPGGYAYYQGTSMAAPQVTGTAGVVASVTGLRGSLLRSRILSTADPLGDANHFGAGRVNTYRAVTNTTLSASADTVSTTRRWRRWRWRRRRWRRRLPWRPQEVPVTTGR